MRSRPRETMTFRRMVVVFLGRGGLGLGLAVIAALIVLIAGASQETALDGWLPIGAAIVMAPVLVVLVSRRQVQRAAENLAEAAVDELG